MSKKNIILIIIFVLLLIFIGVMIFLQKDNSNNLESSNSSNDTAYKVYYEGIEITPGVAFSADEIAKEYEYSEITSCAFEGIDKVYTYDDIEITVATVDDIDVVYSVYFISEELTTIEGLQIADTKDKMEELYGTDYEESIDNKYTYNKGNVDLDIIVDSNYIISIEYILVD